MVSLSVDDDQGSGVSMTKFRIKNSEWVNYVTPFDLTSLIFGSYEIC